MKGDGKDELEQMLIGNWGAIYGRIACQYIFFRVPHDKVQEIQGYRVSSQDLIRNDDSHQPTVKFGLSMIKIYSKFGMVFVSFMQTNDHIWVQAMVDPKQMTMKGTLTNPQNQNKPFFAKKTSF